MSICLTWFPISGLGEPNIYQNLVCFTRIGDFTWRVSDCEELVGYSQGMMGVGFSVGLWFYSSVPQFYFDIFSYHILLTSPFVP